MLKLFKIIHIALLITALIAVPVMAFMPGTWLEHVLRPIVTFMVLFVLFVINLYAAKVWYRRTHLTTGEQPRIAPPGKRPN